jgi:hypothetical protein
VKNVIFVFDCSCVPTGITTPSLPKKVTSPVEEVARLLYIPKIETNLSRAEPLADLTDLELNISKFRKSKASNNSAIVTD